MEIVEIGKVGVDGGSIVIVDPCIADLLPKDISQGLTRQIKFPSAVEVQTGDGDYPVYAIKRNGWIVCVLVMLDEVEKAGSDG